MIDPPDIDDDRNARSVFLGMFFDADRRHWDRVEAALAESVFLDYSSSNGALPQVQARAAVIAGWLTFAPGFDSTHHHLTVVRSTRAADGIRIEANGTTTHLLSVTDAASLWTVAGYYDARLRNAKGRWEIYALTFHRTWSSGNEKLFEIASDRMRHRASRDRQ